MNAEADSGKAGDEMDREQRIRALWQAVAAQDGAGMAAFFTEDAAVLWPNSGER